MKSDLEQAIKDTITACTEGFMEWLKNETVIKTKSTGEIIDDSVIELVDNPKSVRKDYVYPRLKAFGITVIHPDVNNP